jgi:ubiquinone/menaquinone biosynthesis C-methylase UbiE
MARHEEGQKVKFTKAEVGTVGVYKPTWEQEQNVLSFRKVLLRRHLLRWLRGRPGAAYVPFMGDGDIADALYRKRDIYGADLDAERVQVARKRFPGADIRVADCDDWPFEDVHAPFAIADFDAFTEPYTSFRSFWRCAPKADRLVLTFTDGHRQGLLRTGWFDKPDGTKVKLGEGLRGDPVVKAPYYWKYLALHIWPYFDGLFAAEDWRTLDRWRYMRDMMVYHGVVIERRKIA